MKKPNLTKGTWQIEEDEFGDFEIFVPSYIGRYVVAKCEQENEDAQAISAVPNLLKVAIQAYLFIDDIPIDLRTERHLKLYNNLADALTKAGVEL